MLYTMCISKIKSYTIGYFICWLKRAPSHSCLIGSPLNIHDTACPAWWKLFIFNISSFHAEQQKTQIFLLSLLKQYIYIYINILMGALELTISDKSLQSLSCNFTDVWVFTLPCSACCFTNIKSLLRQSCVTSCRARIQIGKLID